MAAAGGRLPCRLGRGGPAPWPAGFRFTSHLPRPRQRPSPAPLAGRAWRARPRQPCQKLRSRAASRMQRGGSGWCRSGVFPETGQEWNWTRGPRAQRANAVQPERQRLPRNHVPPTPTLLLSSSGSPKSASPTNSQKPRVVKTWKYSPKRQPARLNYLHKPQHPASQQ